MPAGDTHPRLRRAGVTLSGLFNPHCNALNAIRLILAACVIVSHSWVIGNVGPEPGAGGIHLGSWAVLGFFAVSGFLITRSRLNGQSLGSFYVARFLRIYPGFLVCLLAVAFIFAPLSLLIGSTGTFTLLDSFSYIIRNFLLYPPFINQANIGTSVPNSPVPGIWNGSLWTLFWEAACYIGVGKVFLVRSGKLRVAVMAAGFAAGTLISLAAAQGWVPTGIWTLVSPLIASFCAGALLFLFAEKVRVMPAFLLASGLLILTVMTDTASVFAQMPLAVIIMTLGAVLPMQSIGAKSDLSYGVYIYGVPVQNLLEIGAPSLPLMLYMSLSLILTLALAWLSFRFVEAPALRMKSKFRSHPQSTSAASGARGAEAGKGHARS